MATPSTSLTDITLDLEAGALRLARVFDATSARLWEALTTDSQMSTWYPTQVEIDPRLGGTVTLTFPGAEPEHVSVLDLVEERVLELGADGDSVRFELDPQPGRGGTRLTLIASVAPDGAHAANLAAGYDLCLDQLQTLLSDGPDAVERHEMPPPGEAVARYARELNIPGDL